MKFFRKRKWTRNRLKCLRLHHWKISQGGPQTPPVAKGYSLTHKQRRIALMLVFNLPPVVDLVSGSVTDNAMYIFNAILVKIQLSLSEFKRLYLHSRLYHFASFFSKFSRGRPPNPHQRQETPLPYPPHSALRASRKHPKVVFWIRHWPIESVLHWPRWSVKFGNHTSEFDIGSLD